MSYNFPTVKDSICLQVFYWAWKQQKYFFTEPVVAETEEGHESQQMTTHKKRILEHSNFDKYISHNSSL